MEFKSHGERLKYLRVRNRMSAAALANHLGVSRTTLVAWESGANPLRPEQNPFHAVTLDKAEGILVSPSKRWDLKDPEPHWTKVDELVSKTNRTSETYVAYREAQAELARMIIEGLKSLHPPEVSEYAEQLVQHAIELIESLQEEIEASEKRSRESTVMLTRRLKQMHLRRSRGAIEDEGSTS